MKSKYWLAATLAVALLLAAAPLAAEDLPWQVKGFILLMDGGLSEHSSHHDDEGWRTIEGDYGGGLYAAIEYRPTPLVGIELGNLVGAVGTTSGHYCGGCGRSLDSTAIGFSSLLVALNAHLTTSRRVDVSLGPIVGYSWFSRLDYDNHNHYAGTLSVEDDMVWGGGLDVDIRIAESRWSIAIAAKYLETRIETSRRHGVERIDADFHPFMIGAGFGFEF